jgi:uncharacterized membrane protein YidH (DUF202 family)
MSDLSTASSAIAINEVQLVLAEKRTSLSVMRTGIAVLALPLSVMSILIATSKYYDARHVLHLLIPLGLLVIGLLLTGTYLVARSIAKLKHYDRIILRIKSNNSMLLELVD